jgi:hypothetical protein
MLQLPPNFFRDLERSAQEDGRAFERESMKFAERLKRQGREEVANYLSDATKANDLTPAARDSLARFLAEYAPLDNLRDAGARRLRDIFLHIEAIGELLPVPASSWRRRFCAIAPWGIIGGAIVTGFYEPLRDLSYSVCRFIGPANFGTFAEYDFVRLVYELVLPPTLVIVIACAFALFGGWKSFAINLVFAATIFCGAKATLFLNAAQEIHVPVYCSIVDPKTNTTISPSLEQRLRIRPSFPR